MAKHKKDKFWNSITPTWGAIASAIALISGGFAVGCYYKDINHRIEINEINRKHQDELTSQREKYNNLIIELKHTNHYLKMVYCQSTTPPTLGENAFSNISREAKICVPKNSVALYKSANGWKDYASKIVGCDFK